MSVMPNAPVAQGEVFRTIGEALEKPEVRAACMDALARGYDLDEILTLLGVGRAEAIHIRRHWLRDWWREFQPYEPKILGALRHVCVAQPKSVTLQWACASDVLGVGVLHDEDHVFVTFLTPFPPEELPGHELQPDPVWWF